MAGTSEALQHVINLRTGIGRENHRMMLDHYQQTKNLLVSYDPKPMGFF